MRYLMVIFKLKKMKQLITSPQVCVTKSVESNTRSAVTSQTYAYNSKSDYRPTLNCKLNKHCKLNFLQLKIILFDFSYYSN